MSDPAAIRVSGVSKSYRMGRENLPVLRGVSFEVARGEFCAIVGKSGSGKSTLLHLVGLLDRPDKGEIVLEGVDVGKLPAPRRNAMRCRDIGFVFQFYNLLPELTVLENTVLPAMTDTHLLNWLGRRGPARKQAREILDRMGLAERLTHRPRELSGGEQQRVAIARALMNRPGILLADEPTGNLDSKTGGQILDLLKEFNARDRQTILMVTHDEGLAKQAHRILHLRDGKLVDQ